MGDEMQPNRFLSFRTASFEGTVAHGGRGAIRTAHVDTSGGTSSCNFIDLCIVPSGSSIGLHTHGDRDEEIYVVIEGSGEMTVDEDRFRVGPGDVVVNRPAGSHGLANDGDAPLRIVVLDVATRA
jgi:mannose-6-phosphate isomerase-like protein (cupin superfamily)